MGPSSAPTQTEKPQWSSVTQADGKTFYFLLLRRMYILCLDLSVYLLKINFLDLCWQCVICQPRICCTYILYGPCEVICMVNCIFGDRKSLNILGLGSHILERGYQTCYIQSFLGALYA